jgi:hypothetical protein
MRLEFSLWDYKDFFFNISHLDKQTYTKKEKSRQKMFVSIELKWGFFVRGCFKNLLIMNELVNEMTLSGVEIETLD